MDEDSNSTPDGVEYPEVYTAALEVLKGVTEDQPMNVGDLMREVEALLGNGPKSYLIYRDLNAAAQEASSRIRSRKGRNGGYFALERVPKPATPEPQTEKQIYDEKALEKHLWPLVSLWLKQVKRLPGASHEIANLTKGGKWSNPDVVGLNPIEELGFFDVEVTTVEVKPSLVNWRLFFFEAVSHKRFSERVYFVYLDSGQNAEAAEDLRVYAEKYNVGLVRMELSDADYKSLTRWNKLKDEDKSAMLDYFVELMPAPFEAISIRDKIAFMKQIGISSKKELYSFGT